MKACLGFLLISSIVLYLLLSFAAQAVRNCALLENTPETDWDREPVPGLLLPWVDATAFQDTVSVPKPSLVPSAVANGGLTRRITGPPFPDLHGPPPSETALITCGLHGQLKITNTYLILAFFCPRPAKLENRGFATAFS